MNACFLVPIFASGENLSFFLTAFVMDDFEPIDTADDIDDVGVTFDGRVDVDPIDDGDVDDEVDTAVFPSVNEMFRRLVDLPS